MKEIDETIHCSIISQAHPPQDAGINHTKQSKQKCGMLSPVGSMDSNQPLSRDGNSIFEKKVEAKNLSIEIMESIESMESIDSADSSLVVGMMIDGKSQRINDYFEKDETVSPIITGSIIHPSESPLEFAPPIKQNFSKHGTMMDISGPDRIESADNEKRKKIHECESERKSETCALLGSIEKRIKQSHSSDDSFCNISCSFLTSVSFTPNSSDLTPTSVSKTMRKQCNKKLLLIPSLSTPNNLHHQHNSTSFSQNNSNIRSNSSLEARVNDVELTLDKGNVVFDEHQSANNSGDTRGITHSTSLNPPKWTLPPHLIPDNEKGHFLVVFRGSSKTCSCVMLNRDDDYNKNLSDVRRNRIPPKHRNTRTSNAHSYSFIKNIAPAFAECTFLLPRVKNQMSNLREKRSGHYEDLNIRVSPFGSFNLLCSQRENNLDKNEPTDQELMIAKRRIKCAICAFGGSIERKKESANIKYSSVFRVKSGTDFLRKTEIKPFFENGRRLSWDVESSIPMSFEHKETLNQAGYMCNVSKKIERVDSTLTQSTRMDKSDTSKKYKCKRCGQMKQHHNCYFREEMSRDIGVMVYPSINAHTADEPGSLAPSLHEMCKFKLFTCHSFEEINIVASETKQNMFTPVSCRNEQFVESNLKRIYCVNAKEIDGNNQDASHLTSNEHAKWCNCVKCNPNVMKNDANLGSLFRTTVKILPENYRLITPSVISTECLNDEYTYPVIPLTYIQRESMIEVLFQLSKKLPGLTGECRKVLREARKVDQWDLAVAELITQMFCIIHCSPSRDYMLEVLRQYLSTLGILC